ncbi:MAG: FkbM family methyltransferase, partial [Alphaproteobacteria bacterium]|nr:FkbM family methyltransferase [Alphaproteobacteria bacterium]
WRGALWASCVALGRSPVFTLTAGGERLRVPPDMRFTSVTAFLLRDWVEPELRALERFVGAGEVLVDVGANIGLYALKGARIVGPTGRVVAVEPGAVASEMLAANLKLNPYFQQVDIVRKALADKVGQATLHHIPLGDDPQAFSLLADGSADGETVETTTFDAMVADLGLPRVDCVKIDVEGAEGMVLAGARETLRRWRPTVIFEVNCPTLLRRGDPTDVAWNLLAGYGYRFFRLEQGALRPLDRMPEAFGNLIARHERRDSAGA